MICEQISVWRTANGERKLVPLLVAYEAETGSLAIFAAYRKTKGTWSDTAFYKLEEFQPQWPGQAFHLHRSEADIEADPQHVRKYEVLIGTVPERDMCSCRGHYVGETMGTCCKHKEALRWLIEQGHLATKPETAIAAA